MVRYLLVFIWAALLEWTVLRAQEIQLPNLGALVARPEIRLYPQYLSIEDIPTEIKKDPDYDGLLKPIFEKINKEDFEESYVSLSKYVEQRPNAVYVDWLSFLKADLLLRVQNRLENAKLNLALEEYELAVRQFPLHSQVPRALYQIGLIKLYSGIYQEAEIAALRALSEFPQSVLAPDFHLINAEQAFLSKKYDAALSEFDFLVRKYPRHTAAVDAAFRKAFLHFMRGDYAQALSTYRALENFHSNEFNVLRMTKEASAPIKLQDRLFFGESLYLTKDFESASNVFQNLANLFPKHENAPYAWIRYGDTFFNRERYLAAQKIYEYVLEFYPDSKPAQVLSRIRMLDAMKHTNKIRYVSEVEDQLTRASEEASAAKLPILGELANIRLAQYFLETGSYPKAQKVLRELKRNYPDQANREWVQNQYVDILEKEILDYYQSGDLLAALTTYLVNEEDVSIKFKNVNVLIRIADAARDLDLLEKSEEILSRVVYLEASSIARQEALLKLIQILILRKDLRKASERLRRFNFAYPNTPLKYLYDRAWGDLYKALGSPDKAVTHYEAATRLAAGQPGGIIDIRHTYIRLGELYSELNLPLKAIEAYNQYLSIYADKERVKLSGLPFTKRDQHYLRVGKYRIADLYFNMRDYIQALGAYKIVSDEVKTEPFLSHSLYRIGECYLALADREAAIEAFRKVKSEDPENLWLRAAQAYIQSVEMEVKHGIRIFN